MAKILEFTPEEWMLPKKNADGTPWTEDQYHKAMNEFYREKYAGLSMPIRGDDIYSMKDPEWALENLIQDGGMTMIHGSPGAGKSLMAMDWA
jgi:hypothetical protein